MDKKLLKLLVCPVTKSPLKFDRDKQELISEIAKRGHVSISNAVNAAELSSQLRVNLLGKTYWQLSLLLGLLFLFVEIILIRYL